MEEPAKASDMTKGIVYLRARRKPSIQEQINTLRAEIAQLKRQMPLRKVPKVGGSWRKKRDPFSTEGGRG